MTDLLDRARSNPSAARRVALAKVRARMRTWLLTRARRVWPPVGMVRLGNLRRLNPIGASFGFFRGTPIDRYYIERFLSRHAGEPDYILGDIRGRVLEVGAARYARKFGRWTGEPPPDPAPAAVAELDILHVDRSNPAATIIGDLTDADHIPSDSYDCVICTQTLLLIYDVRAAIRTLHRILKPGGVLLATEPGISKLCRPDYDLWGDYWRFTSLSMRRLFEEAFPAEGLTVESYGNVLAAVAFLHGLAAEDLKQHELDLHDPDFEVTIAIRAVKG